MTAPTTTSPSRLGGENASDRLLEYQGLVAAIATRVAGTRRARIVGAEYDDLYQEGLIAVWQSIQRGVNPAWVIENRMKDWIRFLARQPGSEYGALLPIEDLRVGGEG